MLQKNIYHYGAIMRSKMFRATLLFGLGISFLVLNGCVRVKEGKQFDEFKTRTPERKTYPKLYNYKLKLELLTARRRFYAGEDVTLTYRLTNEGKKSLRLNEWYMNEADNIRLYYRPYQPGLKTFIRRDWLVMEPNYKKPIRHFELVLGVKNMVLIDKKVPFIKAAGADHPSVKRGRYYIMAELTLNSVNVRSKPVVIEIP